MIDPMIFDLPKDPMSFDDRTLNVVFRPITLENIPKGYFISNYGDVFSSYSGRLLSLHVNSNGYYQTTCGVGNKLFPHRAVGNEFVAGRTDEKNCINHMNGIKKYNYYKNLELVTKAENNTHAYQIGLNDYIGEKCHSAKLTNSEVEYICSLLEKGMKIKDILSDIGMADTTNNYEIIRSIRKGYAWKSISSKYNIKESNYRFRTISKDSVEMACKCFEDGLSISEAYEIVYNEPFYAVKDKRNTNKYVTLMDIKNRKIFTDISSAYVF